MIHSVREVEERRGQRVDDTWYKLFYLPQADTEQVTSGNMTKVIVDEALLTTL